MFRGRIPGKPGLWAVETESTGSFPGARISRLACEDPSDRRQRCPWITPGLFDLQVNGIAGTSFTDPDVPPEALAAADALLRGRGISRYCPTVITRDRDTTRRALARLAQAMSAGHMPGAWGIHMEGP